MNYQQTLQHKLHHVHGADSPDTTESLERVTYSDRLADLGQIFQMSRWTTVKWNGKILRDANGPTVELSIEIASAEAEFDAIKIAAAEKTAPKPRKLLKFRKASKRCNFPHFVAAGVAS